MNTNPLYICIIILVSIFSVILHELAHGVVAYLLGDRSAKDAGRLTLNPLKHIDPVLSILVPVVLYILRAPVFGAAKPVPVDERSLKGREWGMALVAVAGPLTNFFIALITFLIGYFTGILEHHDNEILYFVFAELIFLNLGLMLFNLIPIPPLDGSRVLYAIAPDPVRTVFSYIERYGLVVTYILILLFGNALSSFMTNGINGIINFFYGIVT